MKLALLLDYHCETRFNTMISEGCLQHPDIDPVFMQAPYSLGEKLEDAVTSLDEMKQHLLDCDFILMNDLEHFGCGTTYTKKPYDVALFKPRARPYFNFEYKPQLLFEFVNNENLWSKVVYLDVRDWVAHLDDYVGERCFLYVKRNVVAWNDSDILGGEWGGVCKGRLDEESGMKYPIYCIGLGILDAYIKAAEFYKNANREIDMGCYFWKAKLESNETEYHKRIKLMERVAKENWEDLTIIKEFPHINYWPWNDPAICHGLDLVPLSWTTYMNMMCNTKVILDALPDKYNQTLRPYEAIACGAFCVFEINVSPIPHYFEDRKHCVYYNPHSNEAITNVFKFIKEILKPENDRYREEIANAGFEHGMRYHRSINRVTQLVELIQNYA